MLSPGCIPAYSSSIEAHSILQRILNRILHVADLTSSLVLDSLDHRKSCVTSKITKLAVCVKCVHNDACKWQHILNSIMG